MKNRTLHIALVVAGLAAFSGQFGCGGNGAAGTDGGGTGGAGGGGAGAGGHVGATSAAGGSDGDRDASVSVGAGGADAEDAGADGSSGSGGVGAAGATGSGGDIAGAGGSSGTGGRVAGAGGSPGAGGRNAATGGSPGSGGVVGAGGSPGAGGGLAVGSGGTPGTGGGLLAGSGGSSGSGGAVAATGGSPGSGGSVVGSGGTPGTGGAVGSGGTPGTGGAPGTGGSSGTGGAGTGGGPHIIGTITRAGLKPRSLLVFERGNLLLIGDSSAHLVFVYDVLTLAFLGQIDLNPGMAPGSFDADLSCSVIDEPTGKLFTLVGSGSLQSIAVVDLPLGPSRVATASPGDWSHMYSGCIVKDEGRRAMYMFTWDDTGLAVVDADTEQETHRVPMSSGVLSSGLGVNVATHDVFVGYLTGDRLDVISGADYSKQTIPGLNGYGVVVDPLHNKAVGGLETFDGVWVYDGATGQVSSVMNYFWDGKPLLYSEVSGLIYGTSEIDDDTAIYDGAADTLTTLPLPSSSPLALVKATGHVFYVSDLYTGVLSESTRVVAPLPVPNTTPRGGAFYSAAAVHQASGTVFVVNDADGDGLVTVFQDGP